VCRQQGAGTVTNQVVAGVLKCTCQGDDFIHMSNFVR
jgi:hypothetical protein